MVEVETKRLVERFRRNLTTPPVNGNSQWKHNQFLFIMFSVTYSHITSYAVLLGNFYLPKRVARSKYH